MHISSLTALLCLVACWAQERKSSLDQFGAAYEFEHPNSNPAVTLGRKDVPCAIPPNNLTTRIVSPEPANYFSAEHLPLSLDWRHIGPENLNLVVTDRTHFSPKYCAGCWALTVTTTLSDRVKIMRQGQFPEVNLSPQPLLTCQQSENGCHGGSALHAAQYIHERGVTDETCSPITGEGRDTGDVCQECTKCFTCDSTGECSIPTGGIHRIFIEEFGRINGEKEMMAEIHERGPIVCHIVNPDSWKDPETNRGSSSVEGGKLFYLAETELAAYDKREPDHVLEITGWGVDQGQKYWVVRNSWGVHWGTRGWAHIPRGSNFLKIESDCLWFTPKNSWQDWELYPKVKYSPQTAAAAQNGVNKDVLRLLANASMDSSSLRREFVDAATLKNLKAEIGNGVDDLRRKRNGMPSRKGGGRKKIDLHGKRKCTTNASLCTISKDCVCEFGFKKTLDIAADGTSCYLCVPLVLGHYSMLSPGEVLPKNWDWRNVGGRNYLTFTRNQHNPHYCGGCWSFATSSSLADRIAIQNGGAWPNVALSPQVIINCRGGGDCYGGDQFGVYDFMFSYGVPTDTCMQYQAKNFLDYDGWCPRKARCATCDAPGRCRHIERYPAYFIKDFGRLHGIDNIKTEIYKRGPVTCGIMATEAMDLYSGGIFYEKQEEPSINHEISLVGWGEEKGEEYWIVRNSWGSFWGEHGFMRIRLRVPDNENNLVATECSFSVPVPQDDKNCDADGACMIHNRILPAFEEGTEGAMWPTNSIWGNPVDLKPVDGEGQLLGPLPSSGSDPRQPSVWPEWFEKKWKQRVSPNKVASAEDSLIRP